jgi:hypothetical protein
MKTKPDSREEAELILFPVIGGDLGKLSRPDFVRAWWALAYLNPGLHPDGYDADGSGWSPELIPFASEAWRRFETGELTDAELYPADAVWAAIYDGMGYHTAEESNRREQLREIQFG